MWSIDNNLQWHNCVMSNMHWRTKHRFIYHKISVYVHINLYYQFPLEYIYISIHTIINKISKIGIQRRTSFISDLTNCRKLQISFTTSCLFILEFTLSNTVWQSRGNAVTKSPLCIIPGCNQWQSKQWPSIWQTQICRSILLLPWKWNFVSNTVCKDLIVCKYWNLSAKFGCVVIINYKVNQYLTADCQWLQPILTSVKKDMLLTSPNTHVNTLRNTLIPQPYNLIFPI